MQGEKEALPRFVSWRRTAPGPSKLVGHFPGVMVCMQKRMGFVREGFFKEALIGRNDGRVFVGEPQRILPVQAIEALCPVQLTGGDGEVHILSCPGIIHDREVALVLLCNAGHDGYAEKS